MSGGPPGSPDDISDMSLEQLMDVDVRTGQSGGFGTQLEQLQVEAYLHAYAVAFYRDNDLNRGSSVNTFDLHYFNVIVGANIGDKIASEVLLEYEHSGDETEIRYGLIDYKIADSAILRFGKFLLPIGKFNEYFYPEYINKLPDRPMGLYQIVPTVWSEVGAQLRGRYELASEQTVNYAFYIVNGLEQPANPDSSVGEGGAAFDPCAATTETATTVIRHTEEG